MQGEPAVKKKIIAATAAVALAITLAGCTQTDENKAYDERKALAKEYDRDTSLELTNLEEKRKREDDPNAIRYLYLMNFGEVVGYYVTKGKVSSSGSQIAPETELVSRWSEGFVVESAKDDGSYGASDPGIFFFTSDGVMVETSLDYIQSDAPLAIDVPRLGG
jgi:hypothetical protein